MLRKFLGNSHWYKWTCCMTTQIFQAILVHWDMVLRVFNAFADCEMTCIKFINLQVWRPTTSNSTTLLHTFHHNIPSQQFQHTLHMCCTMICPSWDCSGEPQTPLQPRIYIQWLHRLTIALVTWTAPWVLCNSSEEEHRHISKYKGMLLFQK